MKKLGHYIAILVFLAVSCNKSNDDDAGNTPAEQAQQWEMKIDVNLTDPEPSPFDITGDVGILIDGNDVTFTGDYKIGGLSYDNVVFKGVLNGNKVDMTTTSYQVTFESAGTTYTENISWVMDPFTVSPANTSGNGTIEAVKTPGNIVESGTFSFIAWKKE